MTDSALYAILADRDFGTLATIKRDGRPQLSTVNYLYDADAGAILISITAPRAKTKNYRRARGEHPDWAEFRDVMVADRRVLLTIPIERVYGIQM